MKAFPHTKLERGADGRTWDISEVRYEGMDLRDYFAGQALAGILAHPDTQPDSWIASKAAYQVADNMMKARETK